MRNKSRIVKRGCIVFFCLLIVGITIGCSSNKKEMITSVDQLNQADYKIGVHSGSAAALLAEEKFPNAKIVYSNEITDAYLAVEQGKTDAFVYGNIYMQYAVKSESLDDLAIMNESISKTDIAVGVNPKREDLLKEVNVFIEQCRNDGTLDDMYERWIINADTTMPDMPRVESSDKVIRVGTSGLVEPMNYYDGNQELTGFDLELIYRMAAYMNAKIEIEAMSFDALLASLESGELDMVVSDLNVTEERKEVILMSEPYMTSEIGVLVQKDRIENSGSGFTDINELDGKVIGLVEGASFDKKIRERFPNASILYFPSYPDCIMAIKSGKIDAYITDDAIVGSQIKGAEGLKEIPEILLPENYAFMMSKENVALQKEVNAALEELESEGVIEELKDEWIEGVGTQSVDRDANADTSLGTLNVVTSCDAAPFSYMENGEAVGYEMELIIKVAEKMGYQVEYDVADFPALAPAIKAGKYDVAFGCISVTEERKESVNFSNNVYEGGPVAVVLSGESEEKSFFENLKASFHRTFIKENRWKLLRDGLMVTIQLSAISLVLGTILGFIVSFPMRSKNRIIKGISDGISGFLDGMPLVVILMVLYYIVFNKVDIPAVWVGIVGFSLDFANTVAGLLNTGVCAVDKGQLEAAESMGYNKRQIFCKITFPQATRQMFSQYEGAVVGLVKGTAIIGYITVEDLTKAGDMIRSRTYEAFFPLIVTAVLYFILAYFFVFILKRIDIKLDPKRRPRMIKGVHSSDNN